MPSCCIKFSFLSSNDVPQRPRKGRLRSFFERLFRRKSKINTNVNQPPKKTAEPTKMVYNTEISPIPRVVAPSTKPPKTATNTTPAAQDLQVDFDLCSDYPWNPATTLEPITTTQSKPSKPMPSYQRPVIRQTKKVDDGADAISISYSIGGGSGGGGGGGSGGGGGGYSD
jgi:hypothetical protein